MTPAQTTELRDKLIALQQEIAEQGQKKIEPNRTDDSKVGDDEDEQPLNEMMQAIASNRNKNNDVVLARVMRALKKLRDDPDEYGICEECGDDIAFGRLKAMPYAECCVECQQKRDGKARFGSRKKLTDYT